MLKISNVHRLFLSPYVMKLHATGSLGQDIRSGVTCWEGIFRQEGQTELSLKAIEPTGTLSPCLSNGVASQPFSITVHMI